MGLALALLSSTSVFAAQTADERIKQLEAEINKLKAEKATLVKNPKAYVAPTAPVASATAPKGQFTWTGFYAGINGGYDWSKGSGSKSGTRDNLFTAFSNDPAVPVSYTDPTIPNNSEGFSESILTTLGTLPADRNLSTKRSSVLGGLQGGYNHQIGHFVFGFEADLMGFDARKTSTVTDSFTGTSNVTTTINSEGPGTGGTPSPWGLGGSLGPNVSGGPLSWDYSGVGTYTQSKSLRQEWLGTLRARAGIGFDRALLFVSGGAAFGDARAAASQKLRYAASDTEGGVTTDIARNATSWDGNTNQTRIGFALGAGGEYAITDNWVIRAEYMYYNLGTVKMNLHQSWASDAANTTGICSDTVTCAGSAFAPKSKTSSTKVDGNIVRAAVNYKF